MKNILFILPIVLVALLLVGCSTLTIKEAKTEQYIGKTVTLSGKVDNSLKLGKLSGYTLKDDKGESISVKSDTLPKEGTEVTVKGTVIKDSLFGYYLQAQE
ncbi:MAG: hypothetical protein WCV90_01860 [Candidatus Woesearchaeota archaeon]|jgi:hypothetical protein